MNRTEREIRKQNAEEQLRHDRQIRRMQMRREKVKQKQIVSWILEFSKKVVVMCVLIHAAVFLYAGVVMWATQDISALPTIISESSDVLRTCVFGYLMKAGFENWQKIKTNKKTAEAPGEEDGQG